MELHALYLSQANFDYKEEIVIFREFFIEKKRNCFSRRHRNTPVPIDKSSFQAAYACLWQANDLLSAQYVNAGGNKGYLDYHHTAG